MLSQSDKVHDRLIHANMAAKGTTASRRLKKQRPVIYGAWVLTNPIQSLLWKTQLTELNGEQCGKKIENEKKSSYETASIEVSRCLCTTV